VKTSLRLSNLPVGQTLENFDFAFQPAIERSRIETLATGAWVRNAETVPVQDRLAWARHICWSGSGSARPRRASRCSISASTG
jgi:hypothetical protein